MYRHGHWMGVLEEGEGGPRHFDGVWLQTPDQSCLIDSHWLGNGVFYAGLFNLFFSSSSSLSLSLSSSASFSFSVKNKNKKSFSFSANCGYHGILLFCCNLFKIGVISSGVPNVMTSSILLRERFQKSELVPKWNPIPIAENQKFFIGPDLGFPIPIKLFPMQPV